MYWDMVWFCLFIVDLATARVESACCGGSAPYCSVAPRVRVAGGSFAIRVSFSIKPKRKNGRKNARSRSARLLCERFATTRFLFFFFLATKSQVGGRQREKLVANGDQATGNFEHWKPS